MSTEEKSLHFIEQIIEENLANGFEDKLRFRFRQSLMGIYTWSCQINLFQFGLGLKYNACKPTF
jgi:glutaminyl-tRNA synthetase